MRLLLSISLVISVGCSQRVDIELEPVDIVFFGDHIITMESDGVRVTGIAVRGEDIVAVGDADLVRGYVGENTRVIELGNRALLPGFIDTHGHFTFTARLIDFVNLSPPPVGPVESIDDIVTLLSERIADDETEHGSWIVGYGYDDSLLAENRHPVRDDLDRASTNHPIVVLHVSGHFAATNSAALRLSEITATTDDPPGGVIRRRDGSREPNGVLEESAASRLVFGQLAQIDKDRLIDLTRDAATLYASYGITTAQDGAVTPADLAVLRAAAIEESYSIDIGAYPFVTMLGDDGFETFAADNDYTGGVKLIGAKFSLDGSPQGRTAWMTEPYTEGPPGADADYTAYSTMDPDFYKDRVAKLIGRNIPVLVHANGDAAIDLMIEGVDKALAEFGAKDHRSVIIHAQLMREDQIHDAARLGIVPSFFSAHTFFWGDWHRVSFGDERAQNISPTRWAIDNGLDFTLHNDAPVVPPDMMRLLWATVNRTTRSGYVLGPEQRLTVMEALHAMTLGSAYQFFEEDRKGSIRVGKQADFVILEENPLLVDPAMLKDIEIVATFSRGRSVFTRTKEH